MRIIEGLRIKDAVKELFIKLNYSPDSLENVVFADSAMEPLERKLAEIIDENCQKAKAEMRPLCQDCGVAQVFVKMGKNVTFSDAPSLDILINKGVEEAYSEGLLRKSTVVDPFERKNEEKNLPAFIHYELCDGDTFEISAIAKGGGSENVSAQKMLVPAAGREGVADFVFETLKNAGGKGCPPYFVGVGVGGTFDSVASLAKKALLEQVCEDNELLDIINEKIKELNFGVLGFPGKSPVKAVFVKKAPTHIAMMPAAVALNCHSFRTGKVEL
ncbi:fumarate hydratase [bacterium]|nr:fumarate hydratase [bacterium]